MLVDRIIRLFRNDPPEPIEASACYSSLALSKAIEQAEAVADHVTITAGYRKKRAQPLIAAADEVAAHVRNAWGAR